jgi:hypothetical protein
VKHAIIANGHRLDTAEITPERRDMSKILVIGSTGHAGAKCVGWFAGRVPNAADFDIVVVNGVAFAETLSETESDAEKGKPLALVKEWREWSAELRERLRKLLKSGGHVIAIVTSEAVAYGMREMDTMKGTVKVPVFISNADWLPLPIDFNCEEGDTITVREGKLGRYFANVKRWSFHLGIGDRGDQPWELADEHPEHEVSVGLLPIAVNRQGAPIAATAFYTIHERLVSGKPGAPIGRSGDLYLIPQPTETTADEGVRTILEDLCGVPARQTAPAWAALVGVPGARDLNKEIETRHEAVKDLQLELAPLLAERRRREDFKAILYETGPALQNVVEAVFGELGLTTKPSEVSDEFMVEHDGQELLVEVKGHESSAALRDLRQLIDYQLEHEQKFGAPIKSALVVNAWRLLPPERRDRSGKRGKKGTIVFPDNVKTRARDTNIALLSTVELYAALNSFWLQQIDASKLFDTLTSISGVVTRWPK